MPNDKPDPTKLVIPIIPVTDSVHKEVPQKAPVPPKIYDGTKK